MRAWRKNRQRKKLQICYSNTKNEHKYYCNKITGQKLTHTSFLIFICIIFSKYFREPKALGNSEFIIKQTRQRLVSNEYQMVLSPAIIQKSF